MNKYIVVLKGNILKKQRIVVADRFERDPLFRVITFKDEKDESVALFKLDDIESINRVETKVEP